VVHDPKTGKFSKIFKEYGDQIGRLRVAVPKMVLQVGGSIAFAPEPSVEAARWQAYDTRHMLAKIDPKPDQVKEKLSGGHNVAMALGKPIAR
jgi:hypothetical protein